MDLDDCLRDHFCDSLISVAESFWERKVFSLKLDLLEVLQEIMRSSMKEIVLSRK